MPETTSNRGERDRRQADSSMTAGFDKTVDGRWAASIGLNNWKNLVENKTFDSSAKKKLASKRQLLDRISWKWFGREKDSQ